MTETQSVKQDEGLNKENPIYKIWRLNNMAHPDIPAIEYFGKPATVTATDFLN